MLFDTHAHLDDEQFDGEREELIKAIYESGVSPVLLPASDMASSRKICKICREHEALYGAVGVHPGAADSFGEEDLAELARLSKGKNIVAIGEIGLDYHYDGPSREIQQAAFRAQLALARELDLPVVVHDREAHADCLEILKEFPGIRAEYHCFSGSLEYAKELIKLGFYLSFNGTLTFKNAKTAPIVAAAIPKERVLIETDSPYLAPVPHRGKRNDPRLVYLVAEKLAELWNMPPSEVAEITARNGKEFFKIK